MKASHLSLTVALAAVALGAGCAATESAMETNTGRKAAGGAVAGAVLGGIIGNNTGGSTEKGAAIGAVAGGLAGAAIGHQQDKRTDGTYATNTQYGQYDQQIVVQSPPLAPTSAPYEQVPARPYPNAVWIPGHYTYNGSTYVWESGRWEVPPAGSTSWIPPAWQPTNGGYVYVRGHWQ
jgi:hypothetical protein